MIHGCTQMCTAQMLGVLFSECFYLTVVLLFIKYYTDPL